MARVQNNSINKKNNKFIMNILWNNRDYFAIPGIHNRFYTDEQHNTRIINTHPSLVSQYLPAEVYRWHK